MKKISLLAVLLLLFFACKNNKEEIVNSTCSTVNVTYTNTIASIVSNNGCMGCHSGSSPIGGFTLQTYAQVKAKATEQRNGTAVLYGALAHLNGFSPMPQGMPQLSTCELAKVKAWIDAGTPQ